MRRRQRKVLIEPPARLRSYREADWLPLVDPSGYDPEMYRNRLPGRPPQPVLLSMEDWMRREADRLWVRARLDWCKEHGLLDGKDLVELLREHSMVRRSERRRG